MQLNDAVKLVNMIPRQGFVEMRGGYEVYSTLESNTGAKTDTTNYFDGGDIAAFEFAAAQSATIEFWAKHSGGSQGVKQIMEKRNGSAAGWSINFAESSENVSMTVDDGTDEVSLSMVDALPNDGAWHHIAFVIDRSADLLRGYVDAVAYSSTADIAAVDDMASGASVFRIFSNSAGTVHWDNGSIDDVRVWDDIRTADEIRDNYTSELTGSEANLIAYWKMNGLVGANVSTVTDDSPNSNTLTDTGAGDITYVDSTAAFDRSLDIDLCVEYYDGTNRDLITASPTNIYNSTASGAATSLGSGFTNGRWDTAMMNETMGFVNGADAPQVYDGSTLGAMTVSGSGLTVANLIGIHVHKAKSYFWEDESQDFWYSATNALGGTLTKFQLSRVAKRGGKLLSMESWTVDGGSGPDDYAVFVMDSGEVLVYQGSDPGNALAWALVGIYDISEPLGDRCFARYGREVMVLTEQDILTLPSAFSMPAPPTTKLVGAIRDAAYNFGGNAGWEVFWYPNEKLIMVNVPVATSPDRFDQYVLNIETGAPCRFTNIPARTWGMFNGDAYFGSTDGSVYKFNSVANDDGSDIDVTAMMAWQDYGTAANKMITAMRPWFNSAGSLTVDMRAAYDFEEPTVSSPSSTVVSGTPWGSAWGSSWGSPADVLVKPWKMGSGRGAPVSVRMRFSRQGDAPQWLKTDLLLRGEGNL